MASLRRLWSRLVNALRPGRAERELARELASHIALLEDEYRRRGMPPQEARRAAALALGGVEQTKELHRDARSFAWVDDARGDVLYARARWPDMPDSAWQWCRRLVSPSAERQPCSAWLTQCSYARCRTVTQLAS